MLAEGSSSATTGRRMARDPTHRPPQRRGMKRSRTVFEMRSALSGHIRVIDDGRERRLMAAGDTLSVYPLDGDWSPVRREYWWRALAAVDLPPRPTALLVGLGGGTQLHLLQQRRSPRALTAVEGDPALPHLATAWVRLPGRPSPEVL